MNSVKPASHTLKQGGQISTLLNFEGSSDTQTHPDTDVDVYRAHEHKSRDK